MIHADPSLNRGITVSISHAHERIIDNYSLDFKTQTQENFINIIIIVLRREDQIFTKTIDI